MVLPAMILHRGGNCTRQGPLLSVRTLWPCMAISEPVQQDGGGAYDDPSQWGQSDSKVISQDDQRCSQHGHVEELILM